MLNIDNLTVYWIHLYFLSIQAFYDVEIRKTPYHIDGFETKVVYNEGLFQVNNYAVVMWMYNGSCAEITYSM